VMPGCWEGNRRSLATRHRLQWFIHLRPHVLRKGYGHPAYTPNAVWQYNGTPLSFLILAKASNGLHRLVS